MVYKVENDDLTSWLTRATEIKIQEKSSKLPDFVK